jgi:hypothetical protein
MAHGELFPVSWSKIESFQTCANQYASFRIWRTFQQPEFEQKQWGTDVHQALEDNLMKGEPLGERFKSFQGMMDKLARIPGEHRGEHKLAIDSEMQPVEYDSPAAFVRCIIDRLILRNADGVVIDYKTGKRKEVPSRQLDLSGIITACNFPEIENIHSMFIWTQGGPPSRKVFTRAQIPAIWEGFLEDIREMEWAYANNAFPARPSGLCAKSSKTPYPGCSVLDCPHNKRKDAYRNRR